MIRLKFEFHSKKYIPCILIPNFLSYNFFLLYSFFLITIIIVFYKAFHHNYRFFLYIFNFPPIIFKLAAHQKLSANLSKNQKFSIQFFTFYLIFFFLFNYILLLMKCILICISHFQIT